MVTSFRWGALTLASTALVSTFVLVSDGALVTPRGQTGGRDAGRRARFSHDAAVDVEVPTFGSLSEDTVIPLRSVHPYSEPSPAVLEFSSVFDLRTKAMHGVTLRLSGCTVEQRRSTGRA